MQTKLRLIVGLVLLGTAGCQSYSPYGYGYPGTGSYPVPQGGTYMPPQGGAYIPQQGAIYAPQAQMTSPPVSAWQPPRTLGATAGAPVVQQSSPQGTAVDQKLVPNYTDAGGVPANLGTPQEN